MIQQPIVNACPIHVGCDQFNANEENISSGFCCVNGCSWLLYLSKNIVDKTDSNKN